MTVTRAQRTAQTRETPVVKTYAFAGKNGKTFS